MIENIENLEIFWVNLSINYRQILVNSLIMKHYAYKQPHGFCFVVELSRNLLIKFCLRHYFVVKIDCFNRKVSMIQFYSLCPCVPAVDLKFSSKPSE